MATTIIGRNWRRGGGEGGSKATGVFQYNANNQTGRVCVCVGASVYVILYMHILSMSHPFPYSLTDTGELTDSFTNVTLGMPLNQDTHL